MERVEQIQGNGGSAASVAVFDRPVGSSATVPIEGSFSGRVDWAVIGLEIRASSQTAPEPEITVTPLSSDFGTVLPGQASTRTIEVRNAGNLELDVPTTTFSGPAASVFEIVSGGAPFLLAPGGRRDIVVRFMPIAVGPATATLEISPRLALDP